MENTTQEKSDNTTVNQTQNKTESKTKNETANQTESGVNLSEAIIITL